ncbi:Mad3/BUB1 homology region 1-domain-containing protein [Lactarius akahatsu]|uniref:Mad3/BUB1 homology region 1-domain-containing protein n=1 Tax=Lactarius akahatsu TaxID=416441 RepID=A0AAD4LCA1_9AGAM|nr:Mad3/BUB1 homology region 1-domain-containing protein [Lactarius akahatsu]
MSSESVDVFQEEQPVIVDGDLIEAAKENIQPLASGRRATTLSAVLSTPHAQRESKLAAARNRLRINVEIALEDEDDNPLEAYCQLVYWTLENYPQGHSAESGLLELLEEATRILKDHKDGYWRTDLRYLKLWVLYASYVENPTIIYRYLLANDIGTAFAQLYEEFAIVLERNGRRTDADEIYLLGVNRQASPVERLQAKHREFQKRMMLAIPLDPPHPPEQPQSAAATVGKRKVLGETTTSTTKSGTRPSAHAASTSTIASSRTQEDVFGSGSGAPPKPNARLQVFVDPFGGSGEGSQSQATEDAAATPWGELGTRKERIKENIPKVAKVNGATLRQPGRQLRVASAPVASSSRIPVFRDPAPGAGGTMPPPPARPNVRKEKEVFLKTPARAPVVPPVDEIPATPRFVPFKDEVPSTPSTSCGAQGAQVPDSVMKAKIGTMGKLASSEAEALRKDPFKNYPDKPSETS